LIDRLAQLTDDELVALLPADSFDQGWGASCTIHLDGSPVFVKRLPLTDVEVAHPRSTKNRFRLPTYYSYGVGSAGFTSWRELVAHELTTDIEGFPDLLHTRVMPRTAKQRDLPWTADGYVQYWNGNARIGEYMAARAAAEREVWVVLGHVPITANAWLWDNQRRVDELLASVFEIVHRLRDLGIVHFDTHLGNVITDGTTWRLTDFGLAVADGFELSADERRFADRHRHYDLGLSVGSLGQLLMGHLGLRRPAELAAAIDDPPAELAPELRAAYVRLRAPMLYMVEHFARMMRPSKRSRYDDGEMAARLESAGVPLR
jgi:hypothetical protein